MANKSKSEKANRRQVKYPHLRRAAENMGYNYSYLWRVLEGKPGFKGRDRLVDDYWAESRRIEVERQAVAR